MSCMLYIVGTRAFKQTERRRSLLHGLVCLSTLYVYVVLCIRSVCLYIYACTYLHVYANTHAHRGQQLLK